MADRLQDLKILVAEDAPDNRFLMTRMLHLEGALVEVARDGAEAVSLAQQGSFDLILMDIQMPGVDGCLATHQLRQKGYAKPIVALSAHVMKEERERCLKAGCNDYLSKPVDLERLVEAIQRWTQSAASSGS